MLHQLDGLANARRYLPVGQEWTDDQFIRSSQERETFGRLRDYNPSGRNLLGRVAA
ncbi:hypothetical protein AB0J68_20945 [Micromonospora sp. NPDC049580]|uniref:hypothetical protein n=1 Tax=Micromonospora sp. NPDC049580 TaxID=3154832 RepID=UPI003435219D